MANNKLNIHGANLEDLQETADQHSRPEAPAASDQPEDSLAALRRALKAREDAKPEAPISSLETQAAEARLALGIGRTAFRAVDMLENPTGKPPADSLGDPESNSERSDSSELADESVERADGDFGEAKELDEQNKQNGSPDKNKDEDEDEDEDEERSDKESSEALKSLADSTNHRLQAMADTVENAINTIRARSRDYVSLSSGDMQWLVSNVPGMLSGFVGAVEGAIDGLPLVEASRLNDAVDEIRHRLTALNNVIAKNNVIAEQRWNDVSNDDYLQHTIALKDSVAELRNFMNAAVSRQNQAETDDAYSRGKRAGRYIAGD